MPGSTRAINACDAVIQITDAANVFTDISGTSNEVSMDLSNSIGEWKPFGQKFKRRLDCGKDAKISFKGFYSVGQNQGKEAVDIFKEWYFRKGGTRTLRVMIPDDSVGSDLYEADVLIDTFSIPAKSDDANPIMFSADLLPDGTLTWDYVT